MYHFAYTELNGRVAKQILRMEKMKIYESTRQREKIVLIRKAFSLLEVLIYFSGLLPLVEMNTWPSRIFSCENVFFFSYHEFSENSSKQEKLEGWIFMPRHWTGRGAHLDDQ